MSNARPSLAGLVTIEPEALPNSKPVWRVPIFWFAIALGLADGGIRNFVPATFPIFAHEMGATLRQMGDTQFLFYLSSLVFAVVGGPLLAWIGLKKASIAALALAGCTLILIGLSHSFDVVLIGSALLGFAIVGIVVIVSSLISKNFSERRQSVFLLSGLSDASGSMLGPAFLGWWIAHSEHFDLTWRSGYFMGAAVMGLLIFWAFFVRLKRDAKDTSSPSLGATALRQTSAVLRNSAFYTAVILCFCHGLAQAGMVSFIGQLYIRKLHVDPAHAAYLLSIEAMGILAGRLVFGGLLSRWGIPELMVITLCATAETLAFVATIVSQNYVVGAAMFLLGGFFMSAVGPSLNSYLGGRLASRVSTAFALFAGLGNVGAALGPFFIGTVGNDFGIGIAIFFAPLFSAMLASTALIRHWQERRAPVSATS
jgi:MFS family permease